MRFDDEIMRSVLIAVERRTRDGRISASELTGGEPVSDPLVIVEHCALMVEAGLLRGHDLTDTRLDDVLIDGLTYRGSELLALIGDDETWRQTQSVLASVGGAPLEILTMVAKRVILRRLGFE